LPDKTDGIELENEMINRWFAIHDGLATAGRIPSMTRIGERISASEMVLLIFCGMAAAVSSGFLHHGMRIPGSAIVFSFIPMVLGLALAPRRNAGFIMGMGAFSTAAIFNLAGLARFGTGAFISLCLIGPVMDLALTKAHNGWRLYSGLIFAGIVTNLLALCSRAVSKLIGLDLLSMRPFDTWWMQAVVTYTLSGAVVGLIGAICFFHLRKKRAESGDAGTPQ
jgi:hypothetical protein